MPRGHQGHCGRVAMPVHLIFARSVNGVIGKGGAIPWHLPEDMAHFRRQTQGCPVVMGRKTWDSLPERFRPLPGRQNIVVTRNREWSAPGAFPAASLADAFAHCPADSDIWVIGGAQIYEQAMPIAQTAEVTEIDAAFEGDTFAPTLGPRWTQTARESHLSSTGLRFSFVTYRQSSGV